MKANILPKKVLILENQPDDTGSIAAFLKSKEELFTQSYQFLTDGIHQMPKFEPDVVITETQLPDGRSCELVSNMFEIGHLVPVIIISDIPPSSQNVYTDCPHITVFHKPFELEDLWGTIQKSFKPESSKQTLQLEDFVQLAVDSGSSVQLQLNGSGAIQILKGELWFAEDNTGNGEPAFKRIIDYSRNQSRHGDMTCQKIGTLETKQRNMFLSLDEIFNDTNSELLFSTLPNQGTELARKLIKSTDFNSLMDQSLDLILSKEFSQALFLLEKAREIDPDHKLINTNIKLLTNMGIVPSENLEN